MEREYFTEADLLDHVSGMNRHGNLQEEPEPAKSKLGEQSKLDELIDAYPSMKFLTKNPDPDLVDEWYTVLEDERSELGGWGCNSDNTFLPFNTRYSLQKVYVKRISFYHYNGVKKQRAFFSVPQGLDGMACVHSGAVTQGLTVGWNCVSFSVIGTTEVLGRKVNKVSGLKLETF